jgi:hypothetical protein
VVVVVVVGGGGRPNFVPCMRGRCSADPAKPAPPAAYQDRRLIAGRFGFGRCLAGGRIATSSLPAARPARVAPLAAAAMIRPAAATRPRHICTAPSIFLRRPVAVAHVPRKTRRPVAGGRRVLGRLRARTPSQSRNLSRCQDRAAHNGRRRNEPGWPAGRV